MFSQGGWHGWRSFKLARKEPETRHEHFIFLLQTFYSSFYSLHTSFYFTPKDGGETTRLKNKIGINLSETESF